MMAYVVLAISALGLAAVAVLLHVMSASAGEAIRELKSLRRERQR